jgi:hypothetical protein
MHKQLWIGLLLGFVIYGASGASLQSEPLTGNAQKAARIALAQEFVRELEVIYRLQETEKKEFAEDSSGSGKRWSHFLRQPAKVDSTMQRTIHHEDAETVFGGVQGQGRT